MALYDGKYPPFRGMIAAPQGYDCAHYGAPLYQLVFPIDDQQSDPATIAREVFSYLENLGPKGCRPRVCLAFIKRGVVWTDWCQNDEDRFAEAIEFIQALPPKNDFELYGWPEPRSFMGVMASRWFHVGTNTGHRFAVYEIDTELSGMKIAEEALEHLKHLKQEHSTNKLVLRFPNAGTVLVHDYGPETGYKSIHLCTAIQRARHMKIEVERVAQAA